MTHTTPTTSVPPGAPDDTGGSSKSDATDNRPRRRAPGPGRLLTIVLAGQLMAVLDVFIVNVAAPALSTDLHASGAGLQLVVAGYTISYAVLLITGARLGALIGHRQAFLAGLTVFTAASLACGLAPGTGALIAFRFIQGAGAAVMLPQVLSLIQRTFTGASRARALGAYSAVLASGAAVGQVLGGALVQADLFGTGWRPVFLVNVPIGLALLALGPRWLGGTEERPAAGAGGGAARRSGALDLTGLLLLAVAVLLFTVPLVLGQQRGWPLWGWVMLGLSAVLAAAFAAYEARLAGRGGAPLISPRVAGAPGMPLAIARIVLGMAANGGFLFVMTLHVQGGLGYSALRAGCTFAPTAVAFGLVGLNWQRFPSRWHPVTVPAGFVLAAVSFVGVGMALRDGSDGGAWLFVALVGVGMGLAFAYSPVLTRTLATVRPQDAADASGVLVTSAQLGLLCGVAVFGAVFLGHGPGVDASADALWVSCLALAGAALCGAIVGLVIRVRYLR
ncbi:transmembrane transport protein [Streptomyces bingchenggensis BCW-1]|uniref:Transmembrane transport protein n=1 Tax=Streptomyces bingchenggensis (strain BCW-1) TaxID=749414 RepID=D7C3N7_STRBB|nr:MULTISPECIES: MFS transporter [Streptomyces]ADI10262.1 transmembrane transport protein [Streptomyces bingchenggensis BCW-1]